ncbi:hypothetical protein BABINDRAFT_163496 [Babjeviella inositovora NRRL Y-12698]|uniref:F-box domain-containing protein n=1 Tax=Babjeviella inositovora NRRL Y-12698 TaxID=984486 RepID=A0A1E3QIF9_9ASCO|nr:uncharacterized protein BABINDRAFT_163496 [Babjeviella inositovora NRRL Y-12698]ODQ77486.1 hypothetical protein BABINDRAFT_163496 [Babjeviella inositovora NRRL Y-12698]
MPNNVDFTRLSQLPTEVVARVFALLPKEYMLPFFESPVFKGVATNCYYSKLVIHWNPLPIDESLTYMSYKEFEAFASDAELLSVIPDIGSIHLFSTGMLNLTPEAVTRLKLFNQLNASYVFSLTQEPELAELSQFGNIHDLCLSSSHLDWGSLVLPSRIKRLEIRINANLHATSYSLLQYPDSLESLSLSGVNMTPEIFTSLPPLLIEFSIEELETFSVSAFNQMTFPPGIKTFRLKSSYDTALDITGIALPSTLRHFYLSSYELKSLSGVYVPPSLSSLTFSVHLLHEFDLTLPEGLETLNILESSLNSAAVNAIVFPQTLISLGIEYSQLTTLSFVPKLSQTLERLLLAGNPFRCNRPQYIRFPECLKVLSLKKVPLELYSLVFPEGLEELDVTETGLTLEDDVYPSSLKTLVLNDKRHQYRKS